MRLVRKSVQALSEYHVAQDAKVLKLNQNESPYDISPEIKREILRRLTAARWNRYPMGRPDRLLGAISRYTGCPAQSIVVGNGSNELIASVMQAVCATGDKVVIVTPGFPIYERVARILDLDIVGIPLRADFEFDTDSILRQRRGTKLVIIASPNSPTGTVLPVASITKILMGFTGVFALDEAYFEFYGKTAQHLLARYENLCIIRTLSKAVGLAGIRLGYLLARPDLARQIEKTKLPFSVGLFPQIAGEVVLQNRRSISAIARGIVAERNRVFQQLRQIPGIIPIRSHANFILFSLRDTDVEITNRVARSVQQDLYRHGVLVRYFETPRLKNMLRVTIGQPEENRMFLRSLHTVLHIKQGGPR